MSVERSLEAWEEVQRHGQDLADRLAQGFTGLIQINPPSFPWPSHQKLKLFDLEFSGHQFSNQPINGGVEAILDIGSKIGQAGVDFGSGLNVMVHQLFRRLPLPFGHDEKTAVSMERDAVTRSHRVYVDRKHESKTDSVSSVTMSEERVTEFDLSTAGLLRRPKLSYGLFTQYETGRHYWCCESSEPCLQTPVSALLNVGNGLSFLSSYESRTSGMDSMFSRTDTISSATMYEERVTEFGLITAGLLRRPKGTVEFSTSYESRTAGMEHSLAARGDLWRVEASSSSSAARDDSSSLFLLQLGPLLFLRDSTLLLPVHLSKQHLLWYGYDRKKGMHSLCPALWSKHRRWLMMSMICLNPVACSFVDLQFPNGQLTYVSGEGLTSSVFVPLCGGLLQAQGQYPGDMRFSFSCKTKQGTRITPMVNWPDKSYGVGVSQALAWRKSGLMMKPAVQLSVCSTYGGSNPGTRTELIHSLNDDINMICGCAMTAYPSAFASVSFGRSKWNGNIGRSGIVVRVDTPLASVAQPSFSIQLNNAFEF